MGIPMGNPLGVPLGIRMAIPMGSPMGAPMGFPMGIPMGICIGFLMGSPMIWLGMLPHKQNMKDLEKTMKTARDYELTLMKLRNLTTLRETTN